LTVKLPLIKYDLNFKNNNKAFFRHCVQKLKIIDEVYSSHYIYELFYNYYTSRQKTKHRFIDPCTKFSEVMDYPQKKLIKPKHHNI